MRQPDAEALYTVCEATWPPAETTVQDGWTIRNGAGGGKRVSAATAEVTGQLPDIAKAEAAMIALGETPLFMLREGEAALDAALAERGYDLIDPVTLYICPTKTLTQNEAPRLTAFTLFPPLQIMEELWAEGGIGPTRLAVMDRAKGPKTAILGRQNDRAAGVAYVAIHENTAILHALEVTKNQRRQGVAVNIMRAAARWADDNGAEWFSVIVTDANTAANALYSSLQMQRVGRYHYRIRGK